MLYEKMLLEKQRLEKDIRYMERKLKTLPEGRLICTGTKAKPQFYYAIGSKRKYLSMKETAFITQLAEKKYYQAKLQDCKRQLKGVIAYLKTHNPALDTATKLLTATTKCSELLAPIFRPTNELLAQWMTASYVQNNKYPNQLRHETVHGIKVRSKSESLITLQLVTHKIPFHYEEELELGDIRLYPDFTLRHPKTGELYYWEHFGCLEDVSYQKTVCQKLQLYMREGIYPDTNLIITWETREKPLTIRDIQDTIQKYFM
ncbi:MAG: hypothetical protein IKU26_04385 [Clostridia bacterium]|nr:hypothetical protein [Clostridia bacterium]